MLYLHECANFFSKQLTLSFKGNEYQPMGYGCKVKEELNPIHGCSIILLDKTITFFLNLGHQCNTGKMIFQLEC